MEYVLMQPYNAALIRTVEQMDIPEALHAMEMLFIRIIEVIHAIIQELLVHIVLLQIQVH